MRLFDSVITQMCAGFFGFFVDMLALRPNPVPRVLRPLERGAPHPPHAWIGPGEP